MLSSAVWIYVLRLAWVFNRWGGLVSEASRTIAETCGNHVKLIFFLFLPHSEKSRMENIMSPDHFSNGHKRTQMHWFSFFAIFL